MKINKKQILFILLVAVIIMLPMFLNNYYIKDDTIFHISNILSLNNSNLFINNILPNVMGSFGVALHQFYPILPHITTFYIYKLTPLDIITSLELTHLIEVFLSGIIMYFLALRFKDDKRFALTSSIIYIF